MCVATELMQQHDDVIVDAATRTQFLERRDQLAGEVDAGDASGRVVALRTLVQTVHDAVTRTGYGNAIQDIPSSYTRTYIFKGAT